MKNYFYSSKEHLIKALDELPLTEAEAFPDSSLNADQLLASAEVFNTLPLSIQESILINDCCLYKIESKVSGCFIYVLGSDLSHFQRNKILEQRKKEIFNE